MKIECVATLRKDLHPKTQEVLVTRDFELSIGKIFTVYSMSIWEQVLAYLIVDAYEAKPNWFPAELFVVRDTFLPRKMHYRYFGLQDKRGVNALWGYEEMVLDDQHYLDLIEREPRAIEIFVKRKKEIDEMYLEDK